jgi:hypothetical protein
MNVWKITFGETISKTVLHVCVYISRNLENVFEKKFKEVRENENKRKADVILSNISMSCTENCMEVRKW